MIIMFAKGIFFIGIFPGGVFPPNNMIIIGQTYCLSGYDSYMISLTGYDSKVSYLRANDRNCGD